MRLRSALLFALLGLLAGCLPPTPARIRVEVFTDLQAPAQFDAIEVRVYGNARQEPDGIRGVGRCGPLGPLRRNSHEYTLTFCQEFGWDRLNLADRTMPAMWLGVLAGSEAAATEGVVFEAVAYLGDVEVLRHHDGSGFPTDGPGPTVQLFLMDACLGVVCDPGQTCRQGICEEPDLPDVPDAGADSDAGVATDGGPPPPECITTADCEPTTLGAWSSCGYASECTLSGSRSRSVTTHPCEAGVCGTRTTTESGPCTRETNGDPCNGGSTTDLGTCEFRDGECDETGTQPVHAVLRTCAAGECITEVHNGTQGCSRQTDGRSCGTGDSISDTTCGGFTSDCDRTGTYTRTLTEWVCTNGSCDPEITRFTLGCARDTTGDSCGRAPTCRDRCNSTGLCVEACAPGCPC